MRIQPHRRRRRRQREPMRVVVEVATPEVIGRLETDNAALRQDVKQLRAEKDALHHTVYRLMETVSELRRQGKS